MNLPLLPVKQEFMFKIYILLKFWMTPISLKILPMADVIFIKLKNPDILKKLDDLTCLNIYFNEFFR